MPAIFRSPFDDVSATNTSYFVLAGPGTVFDGETGTRMKQIADGTSRTILLVEAKRPVPWTKPEDIAYAADKPLPKLGGWVPGEFLVAIADGSVRPVAANVDEKLLRAWITLRRRRKCTRLAGTERQALSTESGLKPAAQATAMTTCPIACAAGFNQGSYAAGATDCSSIARPA